MDGPLKYTQKSKQPNNMLLSTTPQKNENYQNEHSVDDSHSEISIEFEFPTELPSKMVPLSETEACEMEQSHSMHHRYVRGPQTDQHQRHMLHSEWSNDNRDATNRNNKRRRSSPLARDASVSQQQHTTLLKQMANHSRRSFSQSPKPVDYACLKLETLMRDTKDPHRVDARDLASNGFLQLKQMQFDNDASYLNEKLDIKRIQFQNAVLNKKDLLERNRKIYTRLNEAAPKVNSGARVASNSTFDLSHQYSIRPNAVELVEIPHEQENPHRNSSDCRSNNRPHSPSNNTKHNYQQLSPNDAYAQYLAHPKRHSLSSKMDSVSSSASPSRRHSTHKSLLSSGLHASPPLPRKSMSFNNASLTPFQRASLEKIAKRRSPNAASIPPVTRRTKNNLKNRGIHMRNFSNNVLLTQAQTNYMSRIGTFDEKMT
eukprot:CAMPEP_0117442234 /NCGR_PEP_ID=MMETSP0759-20121206/4046_1 /TAXON_ID=63605 /ORGANISM="Percolomonas cosmopolitus, Strain WS" /LENGTH=428 /DNA_ID=CAMNT_0005234115 /DNA_START=209 /DNA_END=1495 /DNA_ORIENTATION=-